MIRQACSSSCEKHVNLSDTDNASVFPTASSEMYRFFACNTSFAASSRYILDERKSIIVVNVAFHYSGSVEVLTDHVRQRASTHAY